MTHALTLRGKMALAATSAVASAACASTHSHLTINTGPSPDGPKVIITAGYLPDESLFSIDADGRLLLNAQPLVIDAPDLLDQPGELDGVAASLSLVLTADYYFFAPGDPLQGGDFRWEIARVVPIDGGLARVTWGGFDETYTSFEPEARSGQADRAARSFRTLPGEHNHDQAFTIGSAGLYEITLVAWDAGGLYRDSDPVRFLVNAAGADPRCLANVNADEQVDFGDFLSFFNAFDALDPLVADLDQSGAVDFGDFLMFFNAYDAGC